MILPVKWAEIVATEPEICVEGRFRILGDGTWLHDGRAITRPALVRLFAGVLRRDADGGFWLVTPVEKVPGEVDDAPFLAVALEAEGEGSSTSLRLRTNVEDWVPLDRDHPLRVAAGTHGPRPYTAITPGIEALIARSVYYDLASRAVAGPGGAVGVWSAGAFFPLTPEGAAPNSGSGPEAGS